MTALRPILFGVVGFALSAHAADPYEHVHSIKFKNGLKVVLAPSAEARTFQIKVKVHGGMFNEKPGKAGVAHLLEHYLFTDAKLDKNMTYLEAIQEKGGSGNAETRTKETNYYATVPANLAPWIVDVFGKIVFQKTFDESRVQQAKGPVFLEIGRPNAFDYVSYVIQKNWPDFARPHDFWRTEFGIKEPMRAYFADRLQTAALTEKDLKEFYAREYYPSNMTLFVAGRFDEGKMLPLLESKFGTEPDRKGDGWVDPQPVARRGVYFRSSVTSGTPMIELGTKVEKITLEDETVGRMYLRYLGHRLMKELRNVRGETYTVRSDLDIRSGSGYMSIKFEAPRSDYRKNLKYVRDLIDHETRGDGFTRAMFDEARDLYAKGFENIDRDSGTMMRLADRMDYVERSYSFSSRHPNDFQVFRNITYEDFVRRLKPLFSPDMKAEELTRPPVFFQV